MMQSFLYLVLCFLSPLVSVSFSLSSLMLGRVAKISTQRIANQVFFPTISSSTTRTTSLFMSTEARKPGVASPQEFKDFVAQAGEKLVVVDVRNPDASMEPGDQKSLVVAPLPSDGVRPNGLHLIWDRNTNDMPLPDPPKDTPIITHCGGGGRGQKAKDFLQENGFTAVLNGGGPKETDCWAEFGDK